MYFEIRKDKKSGAVVFTIKTGNGHVLATSAPYTNKHDALTDISAIRRGTLMAQTVDLTV